MTNSLQKDFSKININVNRITRENFISPDIIKVAISKDTMFDESQDGESIVKVPMPESIKATGIIPEGYAVGELLVLFSVFSLEYYYKRSSWCLDYHLDPSIVIATLAKNKMRSVLQACPLVIFFPPLTNS